MLRFAATSLALLFISSLGSCADASNAEGLTVEQIARLESGLVSWVRGERDRNRELAGPLSEAQKAQLTPYFPRHVLEKARVRVVERFENPDVFSIFAEAGEPYPLDLRGASGLALIDTILVASYGAKNVQPNMYLLFHELVHLVQYDVLGFENYMARYVASWTDNNFNYRGIVHEQQAYDLTSKFARSRAPFSVLERVQSRFQ